MKQDGSQSYQYSVVQLYFLTVWLCLREVDAVRKGAKEIKS